VQKLKPGQSKRATPYLGKPPDRAKVKIYRKKRNKPCLIYTFLPSFSG
jgi:hypothetical protein